MQLVRQTPAAVYISSVYYTRHNENRCRRNTSRRFVDEYNHIRSHFSSCDDAIPRVNRYSHAPVHNLFNIYRSVGITDVGSNEIIRLKRVFGQSKTKSRKLNLPQFLLVFIRTHC